MPDSDGNQLSQVLNDFVDQVTQGDSREVLRLLPSNSVDSIVTDPP